MRKAFVTAKPTARLNAAVPVVSRSAAALQTSDSTSAANQCSPHDTTYFRWNDQEDCEQRGEDAKQQGQMLAPEGVYEGDSPHEHHKMDG